MSARAAWRLETLGFEQVYRYQPGKDDWVVARLPLAGATAGAPTAADVARADVPACGLRDPVVEVAARVDAEGWPLAVVLGERRVVLGRLRPGDLAARPDALAEELMVEGPRTIRGTRPAAELAEWLDERSVPGVLVTTADGELVGYVRRDEL
ncbi:MAG: CBS domain-containing protein [Gaiellaceae bacterium]